MEEQRKIELRRRENTLSIVGLGVILFGLWSIVRVTMEYLLNPAIVQKMVDDVMKDMDPADEIVLTELMVRIIIYVLTAIMLVMEVSLRLYIGRSAIAVGRGKHKRSGYLIAASILCLYYLASFILYVAGIFMPTGGEISVSDRIVYIVVDFTSMLVLFDMVIAGIQVRKLRKEQ